MAFRIIHRLRKRQHYLLGILYIPILLWFLLKLDLFKLHVIRKSQESDLPSNRSGGYIWMPKSKVTDLGSLRDDEFVYDNLPEIKYPFGCKKKLAFAICRNYSELPEDILCMKRPRFLKNYKNPCWRDRKEIRCLPYFHIVGFSSSGTTDLYRRIILHRQVMASGGRPNKEDGFWSKARYGGGKKNNISSIRKYSDMFSVIPRILNYDIVEDKYFSDYITGHHDPTEIWFPFDWRKVPQNQPMADEPSYVTPHLIHHINPNVKLIFLIRNPVDRIYSHYLHQMAFHGVKPSAIVFNEHVKQSIYLFEECNQRKTFRACVYDRDLLEEMKVPLTSGFYAFFLKEWLKVFGRDQILVILTEDYERDIVGTVNKVFEFLDLDEPDIHLLERIHCYGKQQMTKYVEQMFEGTSNSLQQFYAESEKELDKVFEQYHIELDIIPVTFNFTKTNCELYNRRRQTSRQNKSRIFKYNVIRKEDMMPKKLGGGYTGL